jgi:hypothetical protein
MMKMRIRSSFAPRMRARLVRGWAPLAYASVRLILTSFPRRGELCFVRSEEVKYRIVAKDLPPGWGIPSLPVFRDIMEARYKRIDNRKDKGLALYRHFVERETWDESGYVEALSSRAVVGRPEDGCVDREAILERCALLDQIWNDVRTTGRLRSHSEYSGSDTEVGGIQLIVRADGSFVKVGGGNHRLMIAQIAGVEWLPVYFGAIHVRGWQDARERVQFGSARV